MESNALKISKIIFIVFCFLCGSKNLAQDVNGLASMADLDSTENLLRPYEGKLERILKTQLLGDINGDQIKDSALIQYKRVVAPDSTYVKECGQNVCYIRIQFGSNIPEMIIEGYSLSVKSTFDINHDGKDEILIFRELQQYNWGDLSLYSLYKNEWKLLGSVNVFLGDDEDYENRIVKSGGKFYIVEDAWNKDFSVISRKKVLIKTK
ncbi:hypothetical protein [Flavobacterium sp.]|uniref:hypothetical protein n=1 Tax=Flavobacterium sp. TaxID=239 RepID=UPI0039E6DD7C